MTENVKRPTVVLTMTYIAARPLAAEDVTEGTRVSVPDWREGTVIGWTNGTVTQVRPESTGSDATWLVRLDSTNQEALYFGYSIAAATP